jgi:hypothetical protein
MKVSTNVKHSTDKKAEKFWDEVYTTLKELGATAKKMNESHPEFIPIERKTKIKDRQRNGDHTDGTVIHIHLTLQKLLCMLLKEKQYLSPSVPI